MIEFDWTKSLMEFIETECKTMFYRRKESSKETMERLDKFERSGEEFSDDLFNDSHIIDPFTDDN